MFWRSGILHLTSSAARCPTWLCRPQGMIFITAVAADIRIGRFKGPSFSYFESEYRFPITRNKLFSGVAFINLQTASDDLGKKIFQYWEPAAGGGLRILFQKQSRSTVCIDYVKGKYGSSGWFFGLNEVF